MLSIPSQAQKFDHDICIQDDETGLKAQIFPGNGGGAFSAGIYFNPPSGDFFYTYSAQYKVEDFVVTVWLGQHDYSAVYKAHLTDKWATARIEYLGNVWTISDSDYTDSDCSDLLGIDPPPPPPPNQAPVVSATASILQGIAPFTVNFTGSATDPDGRIIGTSWDFGDGQAGAELSIAHTYTQPGTYKAKLTVTDTFGLEATASVEIVVTGTVVIDPPPDENEPPALQIEASSLTAKPKKKGIITFTARAEDADGEIASIAWDFGDGTTAEGQSVKKFFKKVGQYTVKCTVKDNDGAEATSTVTVTVKKK